VLTLKPVGKTFYISETKSAKLQSCNEIDFSLPCLQMYKATLTI